MFRHLSLFAVMSATLACAESAATKRSPNIVVILSDDQGWGDLSSTGNTNLATPNIDSLARDGAFFDRFYVCPVCSPTRAEILTGRYHPRSGVSGVSRGFERMASTETTIADIFRRGGYATGAFGKWHNGTQYPYHPNGRGFGEFYGFCSGHWGDYFDAPLEHNGLPVEGRGYIIDDLTDRAIDFIRENRNQPFFCYIPFNTPHTPLQVPDRFFERFEDREITMRAAKPDDEDVNFTRAALAMCENIDWNVGRILRVLDDLKLSGETIVVYFSDNGPNSWRWNAGMRGRKGSTDEGGVRSPCFIRWPGTIESGVQIAQIAGAIDLLPTLADLAGVTLTDAERRRLDGVNLAPLLRGAAPRNWPDRMIFSHWNGRISVRTQTHRLDHEGRLYDMTTDPGQKEDIGQIQPELAARLKTAVDSWSRDVFPEDWKQARPFTVGYREMPITQLPARDGEPHGSVERSSRYPNCSYFMNWRSPDDFISWDIEVATAGTYEVTLLYACPEADVGSTVELAFRGATLRSTISEPHDPPLRGMEHDRMPRPGESYVKDFRPWRMGEVELPAGASPLTLRAVEIPGSQALELRGIYLTLRD